MLTMDAMLNQFLNRPDNKLCFTRQQSSDFAKHIANDFNVLHDVDAKRFCVPGDLLFAMVLNKKGLSKKMQFTFSGMVNDGVVLEIRELDNGHLSICDENLKEYLDVERSGDVSRDDDMIEHLVRSYVSFSGMNFPHLLVPLMAEKGVMFNPARPLVIYESMALELGTLDLSSPKVEFTGANLEVSGKRGNVTMNFSFSEDGQTVGLGEKRMILSNLRDYEQPVMDEMINEYNHRKERFAA
ncbi:DUF3581 domain-containing protein [Aestuariirhabdus sp. Z084]|uniref:DUF3581 family protein n=1 Tax=Aestuariirhabdus haliotis TaxID=2918751 RepID=UPI00201B388D|nr:DUF3581 family protein [Aestuariirhabdus haliotis]MCL6415470.1 DUF3581 domain-containing protein [Aestuariirhabdus haliotis]MCL6419325.1 DUF3581 domain-containing protein [Aestuariirhabdus haliotis]